MTKEECIFCNFKDKEVLVYDDNLCYAIISKDPINDYHVLIIPKKHYKNFIELPDKLASHVFLVAKKISKAVRESCNPDAITHLFDDISKEGYNLVTHYKFHIIPRFKRDLLMIDWSPLHNKNLGIKARSKFANDIKRRLR